MRIRGSEYAQCITLFYVQSDGTLFPFLEKENELFYKNITALTVMHWKSPSCDNNLKVSWQSVPGKSCIRFSSGFYLRTIRTISVRVQSNKNWTEIHTKSLILTEIIFSCPNNLKILLIHTSDICAISDSHVWHSKIQMDIVQLSWCRNSCLMVCAYSQPLILTHFYFILTGRWFSVKFSHLLWF